MSKIPVTIDYVNGDTETIDVVKMPWQWRTFLVLDRGGAVGTTPPASPTSSVLSYVPLDGIKQWSAPDHR